MANPDTGVGSGDGIPKDSGYPGIVPSLGIRGFPRGPLTQDAVLARLWGNPGTGTGLRAVPGLATSRQEVAGHFTVKVGGRG